MTTPAIPCPACGAAASGNFCSHCGAALAAQCAGCRAPLTAGARFCHGCGRPAEPDARRRSAGSERAAWVFAAVMCLALVGAIIYKVEADRPAPATPDMANVGSAGAAGPVERAPDISRLTPRERFDRLFNRIMQAAEQGDNAEVERFTPMALGAYSQLDRVNPDARYHAAVLHLQVGGYAAARALADTILAESPGHLFGYLIRGTVAQLENDTAAAGRARREFLAGYAREMGANRVEYLKHKPVIEQFKTEAERR